MQSRLLDLIYVPNRCSIALIVARPPRPVLVTLLLAQPEDLRLLRLMFSRHNSYGHLVGSMNCGIIAGIANLPSHEGMGIVCEALDLIWPDPTCRPQLLFYDNGCKLLAPRLLHPNQLWLMTRYIVDR